MHGVSHFSNECSSTVYRKSALDLGEQIFLKMILRGQTTFRREGGEESTMDDVMPMVECSFNMMNDINDSKSGCTEVETHSTITTTKYN